MSSRSAVGMGIPMGIPVGMGMGWVWDRNSVPTAALMSRPVGFASHSRPQPQHHGVVRRQSPAAVPVRLFTIAAAAAAAGTRSCQ